MSRSITIFFSFDNTLPCRSSSYEKSQRLTMSSNVSGSYKNQMYEEAIDIERVKPFFRRRSSLKTLIHCHCHSRYCHCSLTLPLLSLGRCDAYRCYSSDVGHCHRHSRVPWRYRSPSSFLFPPKSNTRKEEEEEEKLDDPCK